MIHIGGGRVRHSEQKRWARINIQLPKIIGGIEGEGTPTLTQLSLGVRTWVS